VTGKRGFGLVKRELIVSVGTRRLRLNVGVGEIRGDKAAGGALLHTRWITARELVASRGVHDLCEGKALKGKFRNGWGMKQGPGTRTRLENR